MRFIRFVILTMTTAVVLFAAGCAPPTVPTMNLRHESSVGTTYLTKGSLIVEKFIDSRPDDEKSSALSWSWHATQVWSGTTTPEMMTYLQSVFEIEAKNTRLFNIAGGEFALCGNVSSLKVQRHGQTNYDLVPYGFLWAFFSAIKLEATVAFEATLSKNGMAVLTKHVSHTKSATHWYMTEWTASIISDKASRTLDEAISESVKILFDEIDKELQ